jgi:hypothetical protein
MKISETAFEKIDISRCSRQSACLYFPEDTIYAVLFSEILSINGRNVIKIVIAIFEEIAI